MTKNIGKLINEAHELAEVYAMADKRNEFRILSALIEEVENENTSLATRNVATDPFRGLPADGCP